MTVTRQQRRAAMRNAGVRVAAGAALAVGTALVPEAAQAATFTVSNLNDAGAGSLRDAVASANAAAGAATIDFSVTGTITLTTGEVLITDSVTIDGPGPVSLTINGNDSSRIFLIDDGTAAQIDVTLDGMTLTHGAESDGAAIRSYENLTVTNAVITANAGTNGGGIFQQTGTFTMNDVEVSSNTAQQNGGLLVTDGSSVALTNVRIIDNDATDYQGGFTINIADTIVIEDTTISGNTGDAVGGLLINDGSRSATAVIRRSTIANNVAADWAGGVRTIDTDLFIESSTISGNTAGLSGGTYRRGGGFYLYGGTVTLHDTTVSGNAAGIGAGNINVYGNVDLVLENSIVANGSAPSDPDIFVGSGGTLTANYSLIETPTEPISGANNRTNVDPQLGPLQNNGGLTQTHEPAVTSPVINAGDPACATCPATDQTGAPRVFGGRVDMGSVEVQAAAPPAANPIPTLGTLMKTLLAAILGGVAWLAIGKRTS